MEEDVPILFITEDIPAAPTITTPSQPYVILDVKKALFFPILLPSHQDAWARNSANETSLTSRASRNGHLVYSQWVGSTAWPLRGEQGGVDCWMEKEAQGGGQGQKAEAEGWRC